MGVQGLNSQPVPGAGPQRVTCLLFRGRETGWDSDVRAGAMAAGEARRPGWAPGRERGPGQDKDEVTRSVGRPARGFWRSPQDTGKPGGGGGPRTPAPLVGPAGPAHNPSSPAHNPSSLAPERPPPVRPGPDRDTALAFRPGPPRPRDWARVGSSTVRLPNIPPPPPLAGQLHPGRTAPRSTSR